jgi:predicted alpha/beta hydrolase family esterase
MINCSNETFLFNQKNTTFAHSMTFAPEGPMQKREWLIATAQMIFTLTIALPLWTALGLALIGPAILLKEDSTYFSEANQKSIDRLYAFSTEIFCILSSGFKYIFANSDEQTLPGTGQPILLVHGYLQSSSAWATQLGYLKTEKIGPVYTINLGYPFLSLESYTKKVEQKALEIQEQTGRKDLILIGHSMGGVVSALYATKIAPKGSVTDLFTISSPMKGAPLANWLGVGPAIRAMRPNSLLIKELCEGIERTKDRIRFYHIGSESDPIVPAEHALLDSGKQLRVNHAAHSHLLTSQKVANWICSEIKNLTNCPSS